MLVFSLSKTKFPLFKLFSWGLQTCALHKYLFPAPPSLILSSWFSSLFRLIYIIKKHTEYYQLLFGFFYMGTLPTAVLPCSFGKTSLKEVMQETGPCGFLSWIYFLIERYRKFFRFSLYDHLQSFTRHTNHTGSSYTRRGEGSSTFSWWFAFIAFYSPSHCGLINKWYSYFHSKLPSCWNCWFQEVGCNNSFAGSQNRKMALNHFFLVM